MYLLLPIPSNTVSFGLDQISLIILGDLPPSLNTAKYLRSVSEPCYLSVSSIFLIFLMVGFPLGRMWMPSASSSHSAMCCTPQCFSAHCCQARYWTSPPWHQGQLWNVMRDPCKHWCCHFATIPPAPSPSSLLSASTTQLCALPFYRART